ncbi:APC family permease [Siminovitchia fortis]|uniref:APC family permease n=1 Tax=Siminovitchia fortis TaxID=254758 RepID=A0A443J0W2_9BACI|nr:APC family permease [Siminovitchia fortis]RWR14036.1 APC family permease [Siminovitchia fortis]WHY81113.1 APC family permease [Siminovitchia fortis]
MEQSTQSLKRTLTLWPVVLFGLAYMTPMVVFGIYGVLADETGGVVANAYLVAMVAMLFTAYSYGQMVKAYPISGSAYTFTRKSINPHLGFMVGWAVILDYVFLPMVIWLIGSVYLNAAFPAIGTWVWILAFIIITTGINIIGIRVTTTINFIMMLFQFLVIGLFIILSIVSLSHGEGMGTFFTATPFFNGDVSFPLVLAGASIACYSFLGFDAVTTLSEETIDPEKTLPRAIFLIALIGGAIFVIVSYFVYLVFPDHTQFENYDTAGLEIARFIGGNLFSAIFLAGLITAQFASGLSAQASASRLLFAMGRDNVLPRKIFGFLHRSFRTPIVNIGIIGIIGLIALFMNVSTSTSFINFGAFITFTFVNLSVIGHYFVRSKKRKGKDFILFLVLPLIGTALNIWLFTNLDVHALTLGSIWAGIGFIYLLFLTKGFKKEPPEMKLEEAD